MECDWTSILVTSFTASMRHGSEEIFKRLCPVFSQADAKVDLSRETWTAEDFASKRFVFCQAVCDTHAKTSQHNRN